MSSSKDQQLWDASHQGDFERVKTLASDPAVDMNWIGPEKGDTPLHCTCRFGHLQVVEFLLKHPLVVVNLAGKASPLFIACQGSHKEVVELLLADKRVDVNGPTKDGRTPFSVACQVGHKEVVSLLLASVRIDINKADNKRRTPPLVCLAGRSTPNCSAYPGLWKDHQHQGQVKKRH